MWYVALELQVISSRDGGFGYGEYSYNFGELGNLHTGELWFP